ncbi:MAG: hypothetical protein COT38_02110 [Candidatus Omnitrophica bacterium CG08_land_8_20_14_0_20_41_16]|nr:MAG: hypothetical protein COT38_02110 [Candidatus Omnitrophica bacterium CG08_land_8_20_14_0_20_41_16]
MIRNANLRELAKRIYANKLARISDKREFTRILALISVIILFNSVIFIPKAEAGITLRLVAVNPADIEQTVPVKVYLPMETKPEDILYKEDLEVGYDTQQGSYYVHGEYTLKPKEVLEKEIELKDIWVIDETQISLLRQEAKSTTDDFKKTNFAEKAALIYQGIDKKLQEVSEMQKAATISPGYHISNYRSSIGLLNSAKADLLAAKTLLAEVAPKGMAKFTWKIILFIIIFLGVLGLGFFFIWQRQTKIEAEQKPQD